MHQCTVCNTVGLQVHVVALCLQIHKTDIFYSSEERVTTHFSLSLLGYTCNAPLTRSSASKWKI